MGSSASKITKEERELPSTPVQCSKSSNVKYLSEMDPRSPTDSIIRTPIEVSTKSSDEDEIDTNVSLVEYVTDPRSPSNQVLRTPIFIQTTVSPQPPSKLHNKILDNARRSIIYTPTLTSKIHKDSQTNSFPTPPRLLESSPVSRKNIDNRKSFVGLLETNIDYTETDLDKYIKIKSLSSSLTININETFLASGSIIKQENCDPRSPSIEFLRTPIQIVKKIGEIDLNNTDDNLEDDNEESKVVYTNTESLLKIANLEMELIVDQAEKAITVYNSEEGILQENDYMQSIADDVQISDQEQFGDGKHTEYGSTSLVKDNIVFCEEISHILKDLVDHVEDVPLKKNQRGEESPLNLMQEDIREPVIDLTADVQEFDRKLNKIIYEDEETVCFERTPKDNKDEKTRNRTPMKDRNIIEPKRNRLRVSDKPRKSDYAVSKIPIFREKNCENTVPVRRDPNKRRSHQPKWDSDKTLVI